MLISKFHTEPLAVSKIIREGRTHGFTNTARPSPLAGLLISELLPERGKFITGIKLNINKT